MEVFVYILLGLAIGAILGWVISNVQNSSELHEQKDLMSVQLNSLNTEFVQYKADAEAKLGAYQTSLAEKQKGLSDREAKLEAKQNELNELIAKLSKVEAEKISLEEKLDNQKKEIKDIGDKIRVEFENVANEILERKTQKFTDLNKIKLKELLDPLGVNLKEFKAKVEEVYDKESKERFSLGEKVKELAEMSQKVSDEATNLTKALKGEAKTQGRWGEMILESILEKSGLTKDREYFMEHQLTDEEGKPLRSDSEGRKMRPDAVIKYPDNRSVIIDSKVSLNAYVRYVESNDVDVQKGELEAHVQAVRNHIIALSSRGYDDYDKALDFVMMFIPNEPAYMAALQKDGGLWNFAYEKRILLISPTNLITSLKLIIDLWKREYQNQNAKEIAERGAKLHDKFVAFVANLEAVGTQLDKAKERYNDAYKQLTSGNDNLVLQTTKLKSLGVKNKKELPTHLQNAEDNEPETEG